VNDEIAFIEFAEIDLGAVAAELFCPLQSPPSVRGVAAEEFRAGKDHKISVGKCEAARKRSLDELPNHADPQWLGVAPLVIEGVEVDTNIPPYDPNRPDY